MSRLRNRGLRLMRCFPALLLVGSVMLPVSAGASPTHFQVHLARATDTDFGNALFFDFDRARERTNVGAVSLGKSLSDSLFGWPVKVTGYVGLQQFGERHLQSDAWGASAYITLSKEFLFPGTSLPLRIGLGQGLSYVSRIPVVERRDFAPQSSSKLLVYLEYTMQVPVTSLLRRNGWLSNAVEDVYLGYGIVHRSSAYGTFAETGGGVNYLGLALTIRFHSN